MAGSPFILVAGALSALTFFGGIISSARCDDAGPAAVEKQWDVKLFDYQPPAKVIVEETTPTDEQVSFFLRPPQLSAQTPDPRETGPAKPRKIAQINIVHLLFKDATGDLVPALLCTPAEKKGPFPLVIATHGLTSNKMQVCLQLAPTLTQHGFAVLAADLPCHGERPGNPFDMVSKQDWTATFPRYRKAVIDIRQLMDIAGQRTDLDTKKGVYLVGYSLGSWMSAMAGPADDRVKAMVLMVGGAFDIPADLQKIPQVAAADPRLALSHFAGRPLLLLNGKTDGIVGADLSKRLFAACPEPKKQVWYDSGHLLPAQAYEDGAKWLSNLAAGKAPFPKPGSE